MALCDKAMLIILKISQWSGRITDKSISAKIAQEHGASQEAGQYRKNALADENLKKIKQTANAARTFHYENTLPWQDAGARILPAANFVAYKTKMADFEREFDYAVSEFITHYPQAVENMKPVLNGMFNPDDYPPVQILESKFRFVSKAGALPDSQDFRCEISSDEVKRIREEIANDIQTAQDAAMQDLWQRLYDGIQRIATSLPKFDPTKTGADRGTFRDSLVDNLRDLCDLMPRLNVTDDPKLEELRRTAIADLTEHDAETLREDESARNDTAKKAQELADRMAGFMQ